MPLTRALNLLCASCFYKALIIITKTTFHILTKFIFTPIFLVSLKNQSTFVKNLTVFINKQ